MLNNQILAILARLFKVHRTLVKRFGVAVDENVAAKAAEICRNTSYIFTFMPFIFLWLPLFCRLVPLAYRNGSAEIPVPRFGCRRRTAEVQEVSQETGQEPGYDDFCR